MISFSPTPEWPSLLAAAIFKMQWFVVYHAKLKEYFLFFKTITSVEQLKLFSFNTPVFFYNLSRNIKKYTSTWHQNTRYPSKNPEGDLAWKKKHPRRSDSKSIFFIETATVWPTHPSSASPLYWKSPNKPELKHIIKLKAKWYRYSTPPSYCVDRMEGTNKIHNVVE